MHLDASVCTLALLGILPFYGEFFLAFPFLSLYYGARIFSHLPAYDTPDFFPYRTLA
jgi:hypothetical protein